MNCIPYCLSLKVLCGHGGGFAAWEVLDFIINYDIKYRMGRDAEGEEE